MPRKPTDRRGQKYGKLTAIEDTLERSNNKALWLCSCDCGSKCVVRGDRLANGSTKSCGCDRGIVDETGKVYGRLTVIQSVGSNSNGNMRWVCKCVCGSEIVAIGSELRNGHVMSCGCLSSKGEYYIARLLDEAKVPFKKEYTLEGFKSSNTSYYRFDFAVLDDTGKLSHLIEYDGEQHYSHKNSGWNTSENFLSTQNRDAIKNEYCSKNGLRLIRINKKPKDIILQDLL